MSCFRPNSNFGYVLLGLVIEHVTTMSFINYVQKIVGPLGISDVFVAGTLMSQRRPNEALAEDRGSIDSLRSEFQSTTAGGLRRLYP